MTNEEMERLEKRVFDLIKPELDSLRYDVDIQKLKHAFDPEEHRDDHDWISIERKLQLVKLARNEAIIRHVVGWGIVGIITGLGTIVLQWFNSNHGS